jgi:uncharacterized protein (TIGR03492 family)
MLFASIFNLSRYLREWTLSRPESRISFRQHVETFTAPCKLHYNQKFARCMKLLCLSNGHGEDKIAVKILQELRLRQPQAELSALPIVGTGQAYRRANIPIWGEVKTLPSGGFLNMDSRQFWRDLQGGLLTLTINQWQGVKRWANNGGNILAVGDLVPLLMAWSSNAPYAFVGTAKSEYYLRDAQGELLPHRQGSLEARTGSYYLPWERWLMQRPNCQAVFPRDQVTTSKLQEFGILAQDLGNPMMDEVSITPTLSLGTTLAVTILPGSRPPEVYRNWQLLLAGLESLADHVDRPIVAIAAIDPSLDLSPLLQELTGWQSTGISPWGETWTKNQATLHLCVDRYSDCLAWGEIALATAGTATEQFVGQGKPAIIIPGSGPQFTQLFAERQRDLLGESVILVPRPIEVGRAVIDLLADLQRQQSIAINGHLRMGKPGAAANIAQHLIKIWDLP